MTSKVDNYIQHNNFLNLNSWVCKIGANESEGTGFFCIINPTKEIYIATALHVLLGDTFVDNMLFTLPDESYKQTIIDTLKGMLEQIIVKISSSIIENVNAQLGNFLEFVDLHLKDLISDLNEENMIIPKRDFIMFKIKPYKHVITKDTKYEFTVNFEKTGLEIDSKYFAENGPALVIQFPGSYSKITFDTNDDDNDEQLFQPNTNNTNFQVGFDMGTITVNRDDEDFKTQGILRYDVSTINGSSGSPVIQFFNKIPKVVGIHSGSTRLNKNMLSEIKEVTTLTKSNRKLNNLGFSDIVFKLEKLYVKKDSNHKVNDDDRLLFMDTILWHTPASPSEHERLRKDPDGHSPIFPKYLYDEAISSFVKITGVKGITSKIITGAIVNINNKKYLVISNSIQIKSSDLESAVLQFAKGVVKWSSIKSETDYNIYKPLESVQLLPIREQTESMRALLIKGVNIKQNHPSRVGAILIGCMNDDDGDDSFAFQTIHISDWDKQNERFSFDQFSAKTVDLKVENNDSIKWPCTSLSCLFQVRHNDPRVSPAQIELVGFADKTEPNGNLKFFGFGTGCPKILNFTCKQSTHFL